MTHKPLSTEPALSKFLTELTNLSRRHGFGLTDGATVFVMEAIDIERAYSIDAGSSLTFT